MKNDSKTLLLKEFRLRAGLSMSRMAKALGYKNASSYQRYEDPDLYTKEFLPLHLVRTLVEVLVGLGQPPITRQEVLMLAGLQDLSAPQLRALDDQNWIWCIGEAAPGNWREDFKWSREEWVPVALAIRDDRYPGVKRHALRIRGDAMDAIYPDGSFVMFVEFQDIPRLPQSGDKVVVLRRRHELCEVTVKEFSRDARGGRWLVSRSGNPSHQAISLDAAEPGTAVEIFGLIVAGQTIQ